MSGWTGSFSKAGVPPPVQPLAPGACVWLYIVGISTTSSAPKWKIPTVTGPPWWVYVKSPCLNSIWPKIWQALWDKWCRCFNNRCCVINRTFSQASIMPFIQMHAWLMNSPSILGSPVLVSPAWKTTTPTSTSSALRSSSTSADGGYCISCRGSQSWNWERRRHDGVDQKPCHSDCSTINYILHRWTCWIWTDH